MSPDLTSPPVLIAETVSPRLHVVCCKPITLQTIPLSLFHFLICSTNLSPHQHALHQTHESLYLNQTHHLYVLPFCFCILHFLEYSLLLRGFLVLFLSLMSSNPINIMLNSSELSYKTSEEAPCDSQKMVDSGETTLPHLKKDADRKAKLMTANSAHGSPRKSEFKHSISKINENVICNPHFDPKKMDPLNKPISNQRKKPSNSEITTGATTNSMTNHGQASGNSSRSDSLESTTAPLRPHTGGDVRWEAINVMNSKCSIGLSNFRLLKRLGYGDIGSVYLVELRGTTAHFAMKVMDKASLASRNKLLRAQTEREILGLLDHPFLPTLYSYFETDKFYCLIMEFCSGGNLHSLRQKQQHKYFTEEAARFYASEVLLALEYLHMLGIVYRDLKPENVLVRDEGHIMLSDFDLSLRCSVSPTLVKSSSVHHVYNGSGGGGGILNDELAVHGCMQPSTFFPRILPSKKNRKSKSDFGPSAASALPELMAEPTNVRSMSFVGTHEYLAPEIIRGEGHGSAVDWWTFGIFLYELLHGTTPFKGQGNRATLFNVVGQPLRFPDTPQVSFVARDLIRGLLVKEPQKRIAYKRGATEIKQHPFFEGVNWALVRCAMPPHVPEPVDFSLFASKETASAPAAVDNKKMATAELVADKNSGSPKDSYVEFEYF